MRSYLVLIFASSRVAAPGSGNGPFCRRIQTAQPDLDAAHPRTLRAPRGESAGKPPP